MKKTFYVTAMVAGLLLVCFGWLSKIGEAQAAGKNPIQTIIEKVQHISDKLAALSYMPRMEIVSGYEHAVAPYTPVYEVEYPDIRHVKVTIRCQDLEGAEYVKIWANLPGVGTSDIYTLVAPTTPGVTNAIGTFEFHALSWAIDAYALPEGVADGYYMAYAATVTYLPAP